MEFKKKIKNIYNRVFDSTKYEQCFPMIFPDDFPPGDLLSAWSFFLKLLKLEIANDSFKGSFHLVSLSMFLFSITKLKDKNILRKEHLLNASRFECFTKYRATNILSSMRSMFYLLRVWMLKYAKTSEILTIAQF